LFINGRKGREMDRFPFGDLFFEERTLCS